MHAELCYAESLLFQAVLTFTEDENLLGFIRGGLQIRSCYQSYKYKSIQSNSIESSIEFQFNSNSVVQSQRMLEHFKPPPVAKRPP